MKPVGLSSMEQTVGLYVTSKVEDVIIVVQMVSVALDQNIISMEIALKKCSLQYENQYFQKMMVTCVLRNLKKNLVSIGPSNQIPIVRDPICLKPGIWIMEEQMHRKGHRNALISVLPIGPVVLAGLLHIRHFHDQIDAF